MVIDSDITVKGEVTDGGLKKPLYVGAHVGIFVEAIHRDTMMLLRDCAANNLATTS
jgi:hypothetical protein